MDNPKGFKLEFFFNTNPYFTNTLLTKIYHMIDEDEPILEKAIGLGLIKFCYWLVIKHLIYVICLMSSLFRTKIDWYPAKCLTQKILKKKPKKGSRNAKPITKTEVCESFFNFFAPPQVPDDEDELDEEMVSLFIIVISLSSSSVTRSLILLPYNIRYQWAGRRAAESNGE